MKLFYVVESCYTSFEVDQDVLDLGVVFEDHLVGFTADAGFLVAAERCACRNGVVGVDPYTAGVYAAGYLHSRVQAAGEDAAAKAVFAVVGKSNDFVSGLEFLDDADWSEDFFLAYAERVLVAFENGRADEEAFVAAVFGITLTAGNEVAAFFLAKFYIFQDFFHLALVDDSAELGVRICRIADLYCFEGSFQAAYEFVVDAFLNEYTGACAADLALVEEDADLYAFDGLVNIAVIENHVGRFSAQFEGCWNEFVACSLVYAMADFGGAGECEFVQIRMVEEVLAGLGACAGDDVQHALRKNVSDEADEFQYGKGGVGGRLEDDGVASSKSRSEFPTSHEEREVPRNDLAYNADRFTENEGQGVVVEKLCGAFFRTDAACEVTEMVSAHGDIDSGGFTDRFAVVKGFNEREVSRVCVDDVSDLEEKILAFNRAGVAIAFKGFVGSLDCFVYIFLRCFCAFGEKCAVCRIMGFEYAAVRSGNPLAVDEKIILFLEICVCHVVHPFK